MMERHANAQPIRFRRSVRLVIELENCSAGDAELKQWADDLADLAEHGLLTGERIAQVKVEPLGVAA